MGPRNVSQFLGIALFDNCNSGLVIFIDPTISLVSLCRINDHRIEAGMASLNTPFARLTTSDSVVDRLVEVCFVLDHVEGK